MSLDNYLHWLVFAEEVDIVPKYSKSFLHTMKLIEKMLGDHRFFGFNLFYDQGIESWACEIIKIECSLELTITSYQENACMSICESIIEFYGGTYNETSSKKSKKEVKEKS